MAHHQQDHFLPAKVAILTISDTRTLETDTSGALIGQFLTQAGHEIGARVIVKDQIEHIQTAIKPLVSPSAQFDVVITTGGTGFSKRDVTPEALTPLFTKKIPGFGELFRFLSYEEIGSSTIQSRAVAGVCNHTVVFALPGSRGACRLAMEKIILPQIDNTHKPCNFRNILNS